MENDSQTSTASSNKNHLEEFIGSLGAFLVAIIFLCWPSGSLKEDYERNLNQNIADFVNPRLTCPLLDKESSWKNEFDLRRAVEECERNLQLFGDTYTSSTLREIEKKSFNQTMLTCHEKKSDKKCNKLEQELYKFIASPKYTQWIDSDVPKYLRGRAESNALKTSAASIYLEQYRGVKGWGAAFMEKNKQFEASLKELTKLEKKIKASYPFK